MSSACKLESYIQDAREQGDEKLAGWFKKIQENNRTAGQQGKVASAVHSVSGEPLDILSQTQEQTLAMLLEALRQRYGRTEG